MTDETGGDDLEDIDDEDDDDKKQIKPGTDGKYAKFPGMKVVFAFNKKHKGKCFNHHMMRGGCKKGDDCKFDH